MEKHEELVKQWLDKVMKAKGVYRSVFDRMERDKAFAYYGGEPEWVKSGGYHVAMIPRHIRQKVARTYARNPVAVAERRGRIDYEMWDGKMQSVEEAMATPHLPSSQQILMEVQAAQESQALRDRFGKTLGFLFDYYLGETQPDPVRQMKQMLKREQVAGVAFIKLCFQRLGQQRDPEGPRVEDEAGRATTVLDLEQTVRDDATDDAARMRLDLTADVIAQDAEILLREGPVIDFPMSDKIIIDTNCVCLDGFVGARWVAHEFEKPKARLKQQYGLEDADFQMEASGEGRMSDGTDDRDSNLVTCYEVQDIETRTDFVVAEGCSRFVRAPARPVVDVERFWTVFAFAPGAMERLRDDPCSLYPMSDVQRLRPSQNEVNVARQGRRDHRRANKPKYLSRRGALDDETKMKLNDHDPNEVIEVKTVDATVDVTKLVQPFKPYPIDPYQYDTNEAVNDILLISGSQGANLGGVLSGASATEASIAEASRNEGDDSLVDDLDDLLTDLAKAMGEVMLKELSLETVKRIVGPGAYWPNYSEDDVFSGVYLKIQAGSMGRPNQAMMLQNMERAMPVVMQLPSINPLPLVRKYAEALDIDPQEMIIEGMPSIAAVNRNAAAANGQIAAGADPSADPTMQGPEGGQRGEVPPAVSSDTAAMFTAPDAAAFV